MPRQTAEAYSSEAVVAAQRAMRSHMSRSIKGKSSKGAVQTSTLLQRHRGIVAASQPLQYATIQESYLRRPIVHQTSQRYASSSPRSSIPSMHRSLTSSASIESVKTQASAQSEDCAHASNRSSLVYTRDFPTRDLPLPGCQLHFVEDRADSYELLQEPDRYLYSRTLRRVRKGKALSWKSITKVRVSGILIVGHSPDLIDRSRRA
jgi:hypothetical protein